ncbi:MAG: hypothetical protein K2P92_04290 [Bdellovibrionaceae bacterium]|nr:hypothetical protein [Pseudobdellovibrionaceae bacterium]
MNAQASVFIDYSHMFFLAAEIFSGLWNIWCSDAKQEADTIRRNLIQIERKTEQFLARLRGSR